jgi:GT2 family glycosyltransferase
MDAMNPPPVTVVVSTRNRNEYIFKAVQSILLNDYPNFDVLVMDQSENDLTEDILKPLLGHPRFQYIRTPTKGLSVGRNLAISSTQSPFIAITDDDCEVPTHWIRELVASFAVDHRIGIIFGNTLAASHDRTAGFIPAYIRSEPILACSIHEKHRVEGISACMGVRRSLWQALGGFDEMLGAGSPFKSSEEIDFTIRALLAGYFVYETPKVEVLHHGFRTWEQGQVLIQGYLYGIGAMFMKHLKCGHWGVVYVLLHLAWRWAFQHPVVDFGHRPPRKLRLSAFFQGLIAGALHPVDKNRGHYLRKGDRSPVQSR